MHRKIREAYKLKALETHPDRHASDSQLSQKAKVGFQKVADAYYVLSDEKRRTQYGSY